MISGTPCTKSLSLGLFVPRDKKPNWNLKISENNLVEPLSTRKRFTKDMEMHYKSLI